MRGWTSAACKRFAPIVACTALALLLGNCSNGIDPRFGVAPSPRVVDDGGPVPKGGGVYRVGQPYMVSGRIYVPEENPNYHATGLASWYGDDFHGRQTANGEVFDLNGISAAHPTLPLPSYVRVTNLSNGRSLIVRVNDRGPFRDNRIIDVSVKAAHLLGFHSSGVAASLILFGAGAGSSCRNVAARIRSSEPSSGARPTYSTRTHAVPLERKPKSSAALVETSTTRLPW